MGIKNVAFFVFVCLYVVFMLFMPVKFSCKKKKSIFELDTPVYTLLSCVVESKRKDVIVKKIFQIWISMFGSPKKFLVDNGGEFNNHKCISQCENINILICTTDAEAPWSNCLVERHNAILGYAVAKTIDNVKCDLELALAWATAAKNSLKDMDLAQIKWYLEKIQIFQFVVILTCGR